MDSSAPSPQREQIPDSVRVAAALITAYGVAVVVNAFIDQTNIGWVEVRPGGFPRAALRCVFMTAVAWGLVTRARWAWWAAVVLGSVFSLAGILGTTMLWRIRTEIALPTRPVAVALTSLVVLIVAVLLLLTPSARRAFRSPAS